MENELRDIRRLYDIREVLERAGTDVRRKWLVCPLPNHPHKNYTPSFSMYVGSDGVERFQCHGVCGARGDVIDLAGYLWVPGYDPKLKGMVSRAVDTLQARSPLNLDFAAKRAAEVVIDPYAHHKYLPISETAREFAHRRGLNDETIKKFWLGSDEKALTIPTFEAEMLVSLKKRALNPTGLRYRFWMEAGSRKGLFNYDYVLYERGTVFYVKAEIPAMLLAQAGYLACAPTTGEGGFKDEWRTALAFADIVIVGDNDETGREQAAKRAEAMPNSIVMYPPERFKDVDEWILADPTHAWDIIEQWKLAASVTHWGE